MIPSLQNVGESFNGNSSAVNSSCLSDPALANLILGWPTLTKHDERLCAHHFLYICVSMDKQTKVSAFSPCFLCRSCCGQRTQKERKNETLYSLVQVQCAPNVLFNRQDISIRLSSWMSKLKQQAAQPCTQYFSFDGRNVSDNKTKVIRIILPLTNQLSERLRAWWIQMLGFRVRGEVFQPVA